MHGLRVPVFAGRVWEAMHAGVRPGLSDPPFVKGPDLVQKRAKFYDKWPKKGQPYFSKFISSCKVIWTHI